MSYSMINSLLIIKYEISEINLMCRAILEGNILFYIFYSILIIIKDFKFLKLFSSIIIYTILNFLMCIYNIYFLSNSSSGYEEIGYLFFLHLLIIGILIHLFKINIDIKKLLKMFFILLFTSLIILPYFYKKLNDQYNMTIQNCTTENDDEKILGCIGSITRQQHLKNKIYGPNAKLLLSKNKKLREKAEEIMEAKVYLDNDGRLRWIPDHIQTTLPRLPQE